MTQEQYGQGTGSAVRGEVPPDDGSDESSGKPMTRFQKVASALRGDRQDEAEEETGTSQDGGPPTDPDLTPIRDQPAAVTQPDPLDATPVTDPTAAPATPAAPAAAVTGTEAHAATQPDMFGTAAGPDPGEHSVAAETSAAGAPGAVGVVGAPGAVDAPGAVGGGAQELRPGQETDVPGDFNDIASGDLIPEAAEFRQRWQEIQFKFVDDPRASVTEAADVVAQVTARLEAAIAERQRIIGERQRSLRGRWSEGSSADTETLRETLRMYRAFLDQLLGSR